MLSPEKQFKQVNFEKLVDDVQDVEALQVMLKGLHRLYLICQQTAEDLSTTEAEITIAFGGRTDG